LTLNLAEIGRASTIDGIPASPGIVIGKAFVLDAERPHVPDGRIGVEDVDHEIARFRDAIRDTRTLLEGLRAELQEQLGENHARIFDAHLMILEDSMVVDGTLKRIAENGIRAELALTETIGQVTRAMGRTEDEYLKERVYDIKDIERRLLMRLLGREDESLRNIDEEVIVVAHVLAPTDTVSMRKERVKGFITEIGGRTSHASIMARSLEIPAVVGAHAATELIGQGEMVIIDGVLGRVIYGFDDAVLEHYVARKREYEEFEKQLLKLKDYPAVTRDGRRFELGANIESPDEVESALSHGAEGIGLFRTEYLFLTRHDFPSEEEQYLAYRSVVEAMSPGTVMIRTLDVGGDKFGHMEPFEREANPFLGWRGIRYSLAHPNIFMRQLKAILRASAHGSVRIMFPMVSSISEVRDAKQVLEAARQQLRIEGKDFSEDIEVGIMVETPAAVVLADALARDVDFFSIGSNDLIQYTLAVDRGNDRVAYLYDQYHPAVLELIRQTVRAAKKHRRWVGLCGEMAGDPLSVLLLIGMGLSELSTSPLMLPEVKSIIRSTSYNSARKVVTRALDMQTGPEVRRYLEQIFKRKYPEISATEMIV
jgi:phosphotransferase system enzyme I (PtsI)